MPVTEAFLEYLNGYEMKVDYSRGNHEFGIRVRPYNDQTGLCTWVPLDSLRQWLTDQAKQFAIEYHMRESLAKRLGQA